MLRFSRSHLAALAVASTLVAGVAHAQDTTICTGSGCLLTTTTTLGATATTVGVVVLIVNLAAKDNTPDSRDAAKAAEYYLRQNSSALAQDLASGEGPVLDELATALHISAENEPTFRELMRKNRSELMALADVKKLDPPRATLFVKRMMELLESHTGLRADIRSLAELS